MSGDIKTPIENFGRGCNFDEPCEPCAKRVRMSRVRRYMAASGDHVFVDPAVDPFTPHGPGRYDWDRTTQNDLGMEAEW